MLRSAHVIYACVKNANADPLFDQGSAWPRCVARPAVKIKFKFAGINRRALVLALLRPPVLPPADGRYAFGSPGPLPLSTPLGDRGRPLGQFQDALGTSTRVGRYAARLQFARSNCRNIRNSLRNKKGDPEGSPSTSRLSPLQSSSPFANSSNTRAAVSRSALRFSAAGVSIHSACWRSRSA